MSTWLTPSQQQPLQHPTQHLQAQHQAGAGEGPQHSLPLLVAVAGAAGARQQQNTRVCSRQGLRKVQQVRHISVRVLLLLTSPPARGGARLLLLLTVMMAGVLMKVSCAACAQCSPTRTEPLDNSL
jgi:hypothetical protein